MSKPDISKLRYVGFDEYEQIKSLLKKHQTPRSAYDIVNLLIWGTQFKAQLMEYKDRVILYNETWTCILMPLGDYFAPQELRSISDAFYETGKCSKITLVDNEYVLQYGDYLQDFAIEKDYNTADYIYLTEKLASLSGKKLQKKKNLISQFKRRYGEHLVQEMKVEDGEECLQFSDRWSKEHPEDKEIGYRYEREALRLSFEYFDRLSLEGLIIRHNGKLIAYSLFSEQKEDMAIVHFEKFDRNVKGSAQLINRETAVRLQDRYHYINREEDMGIPGLRKSKLSYQPVMILDSYKLKVKR